MIYLDYTANMPPEEAALERFCQVERQCLGNPNAHHAAGFAAQAQIADAGAQAAAALHVSPEELIFTSGASESNNTAIQGIAYASRHFGRHLARREANTRRPFLVAMRSRNPCLFTRRRLCGWNVLFIFLFYFLLLLFTLLGCKIT